MERPTLPEVEILVMAAGRGERLGLGDKAFVQLVGLTLIERATRSAATVDAPMLVAVPARRLDEARALCPPSARLIEGGDSRSATFERLLEASRAPLLLVHDVVHPLAPAELFHTVIAAASAGGAAIAAGRPADFVYSGVGSERVHDAWLGQSPKAFRREFLERGLALHRARMEEAAHEAAHRGWQDPGSVDLAVLGGAVLATVDGDLGNFKITTPADLLRAAKLLL